MATGGPQIYRVKPLAQFTHEHFNRLVNDLNVVLANLGERLDKSPISPENIFTTGIDAKRSRLRGLPSPIAGSEPVTLESLPRLVNDLIEDKLAALTSDGDDLGATATDGGTSEEGGDGGLEGAFAAIDARIKEIEFDMGSSPTRFKKFAISDTDAVVGSRVVITQSGNAPTGKSDDENEMDRFSFAAETITGGSFDLYVTALEGPVVGNFKAMYIIGS